MNQLIIALPTDFPPKDEESISLCFTVKEKCTFMEDLVIANLSVPIGSSGLLQSSSSGDTTGTSTKSRLPIDVSSSASGRRGARLLGSVECTLI